MSNAHDVVALSPEQMSQVLNSVSSFEEFIQQQLDTPPKANLRVCGHHFEQGSEHTDFDIRIACEALREAAPIQAVVQGSAERVTVLPSTSPGSQSAQVDTQDGISTAAIYEKVTQSSEMARRISFFNEVVNAEGTSVQNAVQQCASMARYLGTVATTLDISQTSTEFVMDASSPSQGLEAEVPIVIFHKQWRIDWPLEAILRAESSGRASLPPSPNIVQRDPDSMTWRAKLPKAMLAGHVGNLQLHDALSTDGVSIMQAVRQKSKNGNAIHSDEQRGHVTFRKVMLGSWGGDQ